jgi:uncharacterized protein (DUF488 family)
MFYRRKIILSILQIFNNKLEKIKLQKLLFLFTTYQKEKAYHFVPYKYGAYSFSAVADLRSLEKTGIVFSDKKFFYKKDTTDYTKDLTAQDAKILSFIKEYFFNLTKEDLIKFTYQNYPYYATKSNIAKEYLHPNELEKHHNKDNKIILFTIGYEGISLEEYLNKLLQNDVALLIDVRNNPISMKYGFSKTKLSTYCKSLGIQYLHLPEAGIPSDYRKTLRKQDDYDKLFVWYKEHHLAKNNEALQNIYSLLLHHKRVALTCFEANIHQCHRKHLAEQIAKLPNFEYPIVHL